MAKNSRDNFILLPNLNPTSDPRPQSILLLGLRHKIAFDMYIVRYNKIYDII